MAAPYYAIDAADFARHGYAGADQKYGTHQAAQARQYAPGALPPSHLYDPLLHASSSTTFGRPRSCPRRDGRPSKNRPASLPPSTRRQSRRKAHRSLSEPARDDSPSVDDPDDPVRRAQGLIKRAFSTSTSGLSAGVLGAIVGGLVAREVSDSATQGKGRGHGRQSYEDQERNRLISTVLGAAVGGLGANAIERRMGKSRDKMTDQEEAWDTKLHRAHRRRSKGDGFDDGRARRQGQRVFRDSYGG